MIMRIGTLILFIGALLSISDILSVMFILIVKFFSKTQCINSIAESESISEELKKTGIFLMCVGTIVSGFEVMRKIDITEIIWFL